MFLYNSRTHSKHLKSRGPIYIDIDQFLHCNLYFFSVRFGSIEAQPFAFVDQNGQSLLVTTLTLFSGLLSTMNVKLIKSS